MPRSLLKRSLRYFVAVAEHGSIRAAAEELYVAQSAVGRQLQALEYEVGVALLERRSRGVVLTQAGRLLLDYARQSQREAEALRAQLDAMQGLERGRVRIAAIESMVPGLLPRAIHRFRRLHPRIDFQVVVTTTDDVVALVGTGEADLGIGFSPVPSPATTTIYERPEPWSPSCRPGILSRTTSTTSRSTIAASTASPPHPGNSANFTTRQVGVRDGDIMFLGDLRWT